MRAARPNAPRLVKTKRRLDGAGGGAHTVRIRLDGAGASSRSGQFCSIMKAEMMAMIPITTSGMGGRRRPARGSPRAARCGARGARPQTGRTAVPPPRNGTAQTAQAGPACLGPKRVASAALAGGEAKEKSKAKSKGKEAAERAAAAADDGGAAAEAAREAVQEGRRLLDVALDLGVRHVAAAAALAPEHPLLRGCAGCVAAR